MRFIGFSPVLFIVLIVTAEFTAAQSSGIAGLPKGPSFVASLDRSIQSSDCKNGDAVSLRVVQSFLLGQEVVPAGARVSAHIVIARKYNKQARTEAVLGISADQVSWKQKSIPLHAWIVGFVSRKITTAYYGVDRVGADVDRSWWDKLNETTDRPIPDSTHQTLGTREFSTLDPNANTIKLGANTFVGHLKVRRKPSTTIGAALVHDDGDVKLPKGLLVVMEQIETGASAS
jgi:hypothetical protein